MEEMKQKLVDLQEQIELLKSGTPEEKSKAREDLVAKVKENFQNLIKDVQVDNVSKETIDAIKNGAATNDKEIEKEAQITIRKVHWVYFLRNIGKIIASILIKWRIIDGLVIVIAPILPFFLDILGIA